MRFGVLGTGRITRRLVADLQSTAGITVDAIASRDEGRARWSGTEYGIAKAYGDYATLLGDPDLDAVYVALPPALHTQWCLDAAAAGKHILCEKPLATSLADVRAIDRSCREHGVRWLDATAWMHHERTQQLRQWIDARMIGKLKHISAAISFFEPFQHNDHRLDPALGGGCVLDLGWYAAGAAILAAGAPRRVIASTLWRDAAARRCSGILWFDDDVTATVNCGYDMATRKWCEWAGDEASIVCDDFSRPWADRPARVWVHNRAGEVQKHEFGGSQERNMIAKLASPEPLGWYHLQAMRTQAAVDAMIRSGESGQVEIVESVDDIEPNETGTATSTDADQETSS
jgi:predicted dehydrogenase